MKTFTELLYPDHGQYLAVANVLYDGRTDHQDVLVFENPTFGKVLALDGVVQLTERDHHIYHEMIAHVPLMAHGNARDVLIIGGGDGGVLKEVLKHPVASVTLVELDRGVIDIAQRYLPAVCRDVFADPRVSLVIGDGANYVATSGRRFDVIIVDSTDPVGPGEVLFGDRFYEDCRASLRGGGLIAIQGGCAFYQPDRLAQTLARLRDRFGAARAFLAPVPTYANGLLALMVAGQEDVFMPAPEVLRSRIDTLGLNTDYYSPAVHHAAFAIAPRFDARTAANEGREPAATRLPDWIARPIDRRRVAAG